MCQNFIGIEPVRPADSGPVGMLILAHFHSRAIQCSNEKNICPTHSFYHVDSRKTKFLFEMLFIVSRYFVLCFNLNENQNVRPTFYCRFTIIPHRFISHHRLTANNCLICDMTACVVWITICKRLLHSHIQLAFSLALTSTVLKQSTVTRSESLFHDLNPVPSVRITGLNTEVPSTDRAGLRLRAMHQMYQRKWDRIEPGSRGRAIWSATDCFAVSAFVEIGFSFEWSKGRPL